MQKSCNNEDLLSPQNHFTSIFRLEVLRDMSINLILSQVNQEIFYQLIKKVIHDVSESFPGLIFISSVYLSREISNNMSALSTTRKHLKYSTSNIFESTYRNLLSHMLDINCNWCVVQRHLYSVFHLKV